VSLHVLVSVNTLPVPARGDAAAADLVPAIAVTAITLLVLLPVADGSGGPVFAKLWGQFQGTVYVMCQEAYPLV
jgi:hypothetical protein